MRDWLVLHDIDQVFCERLFAIAEKYCDPKVPKRSKIQSSRLEITADQAWQQAADAMCRRFPRSLAIVETVILNVKTDFSPNPATGSRAFTLNDGGNGFPLVSCNFRNSASDCLIIAHEFGHAVQIVASKGQFLTPVMREFCAFIGELALLSYLQNCDQALHHKLLPVWQSDSSKLFDQNLQSLKAALNDLNTPYDYQWNYPISRVLSLESETQLSSEKIWEQFGAKSTPRGLAGLLGL